MIEPRPRPATRDTVQVRPFAGDDMDAVMRIMETAFAAAFGEAWTRSQCAGILPMAGVALRLATTSDGAIAGFALSRAVADEAELLLIAVDPVRQQQGIGAALVDDFMDFARSRGASRVHLEVRAGNSALLLYERAGFAVVGRRRDYYRGSDGDKHDALTLSLDL